MGRILLVHYSEIGTKGRNRAVFEKKLMENVKGKIKECAENCYRRYGCIIFELVKGFDIGKICERLKCVPGVANFAFGEKTKLDISDIEKILLDVVNGDVGFDTFKISANRSNKNFGFNSKQIEEKFGRLIVEKFGKKVDLNNPNKTFYIDIGEKEAFVYCEKIKGIGGLPAGISGKVVVSLSGGIDSPVASYLMMKRGCECIFAHFYHDGQSISKAEELSCILKNYQNTCKLYLINFKDIQNEIIKNVGAEERMIVYRRFMIKILEKISEKENAKAIVTGDSVGQVASQTLENIKLIQCSIGGRIPILCPLIGINKEESISLAREIGTYNISIKQGEDCCSFMIAEHPSTKGSLRKIKFGEEKINLELIKNAVNSAKVQKTG